MAFRGHASGLAQALALVLVLVALFLDVQDRAFGQLVPDSPPSAAEIPQESKLSHWHQCPWDGSWIQVGVRGLALGEFWARDRVPEASLERIAPSEECTAPSEETAPG